MAGLETVEQSLQGLVQYASEDAGHCGRATVVGVEIGAVVVGRAKAEGWRNG